MFHQILPPALHPDVWMLGVLVVARYMAKGLTGTVKEASLFVVMLTKFLENFAQLRDEWRKFRNRK